MVLLLLVIKVIGVDAEIGISIAIESGDVNAGGVGGIDDGVGTNVITGVDGSRGNGTNMITGGVSVVGSANMITSVGGLMLMMLVLTWLLAVLVLLLVVVLTLLLIGGIDVDDVSADIYSNGVVGDGTNVMTDVAGGANLITAIVGDANIVTGLGVDVDDGSVGAGVADMITGVVVVVGSGGEWFGDAVVY